MLDKYFQDIAKVAKQGDAREESYYPALKNFLDAWATKNKIKAETTAQPKKTDAGNPDFRIWGNKKRVVGYIEAKAPSVTDLDKIEKTEQLQRYLTTFPNVILTNFLEFRLYRNSELVGKVSIGESLVINDLKMAPPIQNEEKFLELLKKFYAFSIPKTTSAKQLASELAKYTRFLRDQVIAQELQEEQIEGTQRMEAYYQSFKKHLITSLDVPQFADLFSQTVAYGLFAARFRAGDDFNRELAYKYIPPTVGILRDVFKFISSDDLSDKMQWTIDDISEVLASTDVKKIINNFYKEGKGRDPIIHFYETFLTEYNPTEREKRGVYYTPEPIVGYITRSVHKLLKSKFDKKDGFATPSVTVLDPAAGTLTFLSEAIRLAIDEYKEKYGNGIGGDKGLIKTHILENFYAFELMMAPYAIGHLKMGFVLDEYKYKLDDKDRFKLYLTNTLDFKKEDEGQFVGMFEEVMAEEAREALKVKEEIPIMVVMGNPPYSGHSENKGDWIMEQMKEYKQINGKPLGEKNPKWLNDDYVKFLRFSQWQIERAEQGIVGFITNHAWLDNPTFRGMRASLLKTFDEIYIYNLHGNSLSKEKTPDGEKDENVFDIRAGVSIVIGIKNNDIKQKQVLYQDLWGKRDNKYEVLDKNDIESTKWQHLTPTEPSYWLVPKSEKGKEQYDLFIPVNKIFPINSVGIVTARDNLTIAKTPEEVWNRVVNFVDMESELARSGFQLGKDAKDWKIKLAQNDLKESGLDKKKIVPILYRPFDVRYTYYTGKSSGFHCRPRPKVMNNMLQPNLALITRRQMLSGNYSYVSVSEGIVSDGVIRSDSKGGESIFPLNCYINDQQKELFGPKNKEPNIDLNLFEMLSHQYEIQSPEHEIFYYIYAVLHSNIYREQYGEFMESDFPRIPFTRNPKLFMQLADLGKTLVDLHLLKHFSLDKPSAKFKGTDDGSVDNIKFLDIQSGAAFTKYANLKLHSKGIVKINDKEYFAGIPKEVWEYQIGGYQVLNKWLKDRKGDKLSAEDIKHYLQIIASITKTIELQKEIDELYPKVEKTLLDINITSEKS